MHDWLRDEKNGRWLLVIDNADNTGVLSDRVGNSLATAEQANDGDSTNSSGAALQQHLREYLPPSQHGSVLVTSCTRRAAMEVVEDNDIVLIGPIEEAAARALLRQMLGDKEGVDNDTALLAAALDYMPLALVQAAVYIRQRAPRCSVQYYLEEYQQSDGRATSLLNREAGYLRRDKSASNAILITWQILFKHVRSTRQSAADLLLLMSFVDQQGIPEALLRSRNCTVSNDEFENDIETLRDYSFVAVIRDANAFETHGLVELAMREWLVSQEQLDKWRDQFISSLCVEFPAVVTYENWETCHAFFPRAKAALVQQPTGQRSLENWAYLLYNAAWYKGEQGRAGETEQMAVMSMVTHIEVLGEECITASYSLRMVARARELGSKYEEAEVMCRKTQAIHEKVLEPGHPDILTSMNKLALVLDEQGKFEEAEALLRQALTSREKMFGRKHPKTLTSTQHLARVMMHQSQQEEADGLLRQTLVIQQKVLGPEHPFTIASMKDLACAILDQCRYEEGEGILRWTIDVSEKILGRKHPSTLRSVSSLALVLAKQSCFRESLALDNSACDPYSGSLEEGHPDTRACHRDRYKMLALQEQSQMDHPTAGATNGTITHKDKASIPSRWLAKLRMRNSKHKKG